MLAPAQLAALAAIHRRGSFDLAAADLRVTPSAVSQRIRALEEAVGTLLIRRGQPCEATPAAMRLIRHYEEVQLLEQALIADLPGLTAGAGTLRIAVNADSLATWVIPALAASPGYLFDLVIDDQDASQDWLTRGEVTGAITSLPGPLQGCDTLPLGVLRYRATASPAFVARFMPDGPTPPALATAPGLTFSEKDQLQHRWIAALTGLDARRVSFPAHRIGSPQGFVEACLSGLGWALNPEPLVAAHLAAGRLRDLAPNRPFDVPLYWQFTRAMASALQPLTRSLRAAAASVLLPPG